MTVYIEKPALSLRSELASLRNQGGYQEQQFYFDSLVTNGTFDTDTNWISYGSDAASSSISGGVATIFGNAGYYQFFTTVIGRSYRASVNVNSTSGSNSELKVGTTANGEQNLKIVTAAVAAYSGTFIATATTTFVNLKANYAVGSTQSTVYDNVSVFNSDGTDVIHTMPQGWKPKDFFEDGLLQREGALNDYEVIYDGFDYVIKPTVAPSATTQTCVIGVKA